MRRKWIAVLSALAALVFPAVAEEPRAKFYLEDGKVIRRVAAVESDVETLKREVAELREAVGKRAIEPATTAADLRAAGVNPLVIADVLKLIADLRAKAPREVIVADVLAILAHLSGPAAAEPTIAPVSGACYVDPATGQTVCPGGTGWLGYGVFGPGTRRGLFRR
jgi:hypothetical protein